MWAESYFYQFPFIYYTHSIHVSQQFDLYSAIKSVYSLPARQANPLPAAMDRCHFLLMSCAAQGHINPMIQLATRLLHLGAARVTFATTVNGLSRIKTFPSIDGLLFATFSDGFDDGVRPTNDRHRMMSELQRVGSRTLNELLVRLSDEGHPVSFLIYSLLLPWAADVARYFSIPSALLCIQSTTSFAIFHRYFNKHDGLHEKNENNPPGSVEIHGLPLFANQDLPSFLLPNSPHAAVAPVIQQHIQTLEQDPRPCVLVNSFDCLEEKAIRAIGELNPICIGPLIPLAFLDENCLSDTSGGCDLFEKSTEYMQWLNSKPNGSVVFISFGSLVVLQRNQMDEILHGLIDSRRPFLWVIRPSDDKDREFEDMAKKKVKEEGGLIVPWCSQMEVLTHEAVGCFVSHCGWNSTMESLVAGVPVVGFPQSSDQMTNAKLVEEVWGTGVRARVNGGGVVEAEEIRRSLQIVMGDGGMRGNAKKWRREAMNAVKEGGSSYNNLKAFMDAWKNI